MRVARRMGRGRWDQRRERNDPQKLRVQRHHEQPDESERNTAPTPHPCGRGLRRRGRRRRRRRRVRSQLCRGSQRRPGQGIVIGFRTWEAGPSRLCYAAAVPFSGRVRAVARALLILQELVARQLCKVKDQSHSSSFLLHGRGRPLRQGSLQDGVGLDPAPRYCWWRVRRGGRRSWHGRDR